MIARSLRALGVALAGLPTALASAQAIAPLTTDIHTKKHNEPHDKVLDNDRFHTSRTGAPLFLPAEEDAFVFAVFGDRTGGPNEGIDILAQAIHDTNLLEPDLVMTVGDMIQGYNQTPGWLEQMNQYKHVMNELLCPWFPVAGNHDVYWRGPDRPEGEHEANYEVNFGPLWYSFDHKGSTFIALYSDEGNPSTGEKSISRPDTQVMSDEQFNWLAGALERASGSNHVFIFLHHPRWIGGRYGDDWEKVHELLVSAGNVSAVFAGHIHRMRYDPRDGIEYVTLATVGGSNQLISKEAGFLHHFDIVTVREDQIALATLPVGEVIDVREVTGEISELASAVSGMSPTFASTVEVASDGSVSDTIQVTVANPVDASLDIEVRPTSRDSRWTIYPDHDHGRLEPGETKSYRFRLSRPADMIDEYLRPVSVELGVDLLTSNARFPMKTVETTVPGTLILEEPAMPSTEAVLSMSGENAGAVVDLASVALEDGPLTVECWVKPRSFNGRDGVIGSGAYGFWFDGGRPVFYVRANGRWTDAAMDEGRTLDPGQWYHFAGVFDGSEVRFYIDGELIDRVQVSGSLRFAGELAVGADTNRSGGVRNTLDGVIDEVRVSEGARYRGSSFRPQRRFEADRRTRLLLHMDGAVGEYLYDSSGAAAHPKIVGEAVITNNGG
ncbi:MAG: LamG-like jellyroll fold domain-containing protein [Planctomycetota bacterium]